MTRLGALAVAAALAACGPDAPVRDAGAITVERPRPDAGVPAIVLGADVDPASTVVVADAWRRLAALYHDTTGVEARLTLERIDVRRAFSLDASEAAAARPGLIEVRAGPANARALAHETAHQLLFSTCAAATRDTLFHEAFALATSGEAEAWADEQYVTLPVAAETLAKQPLSTRAARRALARVLREGGAGAARAPRDPTAGSAPAATVPAAVAAALRRCADDAPWVPLTVDDLVGLSADRDVDALVVLHRASGEALEERGASAKIPFGSTLKPFLLAGAPARAGALPRFTKRPTEPSWACPGVSDRAPVTAEQALLASCNGWFLDWGAHDPAAHTFGAWGPVLLSLGLSGPPDDMSAAIGARTSLRMAPRAIAEAYRALAASGHDVVELLERRGTLVGAAGVDALAGAAAKTGTVRDEQSRPVVGWLVATTDTLVVVRARSGVPARSLVKDVTDAVARHTSAANAGARVQTFGLLPEADVQVRCRGVPVRAARAPSVSDGGAWLALADVVRDRAAAVCAGAPWEVRFVDDPQPPRPYAGLFVRSDPPARADADVHASERQTRARRGSAFVFETRALSYVRGVLDAEDAQIRGEARAALARVIAHDALHSDERHPGRPPCDTTHCMTFLGTRGREDPIDLVALAHGDAQALAGRGWLMFSQGGSEPWKETRSGAEVRAKLGTFTQMIAQGGDAVLVRALGDADDVERVSCEQLRTKLALPGCADTITASDTAFTFAGAGRGHGQGLDVEHAKARAAKGASADELLGEAYPR